MGGGFMDPGPETKLRNQPGGQQLVWDLRYQNAWKGESGRNIRGPMVAPGDYQVELVVDGTTHPQTFSVMADPRVVTAGVTHDALLYQEKLALQIRDLITETRQMADYVQTRRKEIKELTESGKGGKKLIGEEKALATVESELVTAEGRYMTPMIIDQLRYLYSMLDRADQMPGKDATERYQELKLKVDNLKSQNSKFLAKL